MASSAVIFFRFGAACECICHYRRGEFHCFDDGCCGREGRPPLGNLRDVLAKTLQEASSDAAK